jgi:hypothetical protein
MAANYSITCVYACMNECMPKSIYHTHITIRQVHRLLVKFGYAWFVFHVYECMNVCALRRLQYITDNAEYYYSSTPVIQR